MRLVDLVYTYVNGADPDFIRRCQEQHQRQGVPLDGALTWYQNLGEIGYSVQSALNAMPWIRTIFILTDGQRPPVSESLIDSGRVKLVDHSDIIPVQFRPALASTIIESFIHRIPGLSDVYLYNNDDFFHGSPISVTEFLTGSGKLRLRVSPAIFREGLRRCSAALPLAFPKANRYTYGISNAARLLRQRNVSWRNIVVPRHVTQVYRKSTAYIVEQHFTECLNLSRARHVRTREQISWSTLMYSLESLIKRPERLKAAYLPSLLRDELFLDFSAYHWESQLRSKWRRAESSTAKFICLNNMRIEQMETFRNLAAHKNWLAPGISNGQQLESGFPARQTTTAMQRSFRR